MTDRHSRPVPGGMGTPTAGPVGARAATHRRPGILTFAAILMFIVAGLEGLSALLELAGTGWWVTETISSTRTSSSGASST